MFIYVILLLVTMIILISFTEFNKNKRIKKKQEIYIHRKIINLEMKRDFYVLNDMFLEYGLLLEEIDKLIDLAKEEKFEFKNVKWKRKSFFKVAFDKNKRTRFIEYRRQYIDCKEKNKELFDFTDSCIDTKLEIIKLKYPLKLLIDYVLDEFEMFLLNGCVLFLEIELFILERIVILKGTDKIERKENEAINQIDGLRSVDKKHQYLWDLCM